MLEHAHKMIQHTTTIINYNMNDDHYLSSNKWVHYPLLEVRGITTTKTVLVIAEGAPILSRFLVVALALCDFVTTTIGVYIYDSKW